MPAFHVASEDSAERVCAHIRARSAKEPLVVTVERPRRLRTLQANARYWVILAMIAEHVRPEGRFHEKETWHEYFRRKFLPPVEIELPNGKVILEYPSTATLPATAEDTEPGKPNFRDYSTQVEVWANEHGVILGTDS